MIIQVLILIFGFVLLIFGANWLVNGASSLAKRFNISDLTIGLTIVAFGTSAPELIVNAISSFDGQNDLVYGNVIGSNNFNLFIILGIVGLIMPISVKTITVWREIPFSFFSALAVLVLSGGLFSSQDPILNRVDAGLLFICFIAFLLYVFSSSKNEVVTHTESKAGSEVKNDVLIKLISLCALGLTFLILGGKLVVDAAIDISSDLGISQKIIGLTVVAAGTSLPELVTSIVAAIKKNSDIAIGNVLGSNIFNLLFVLSGSAMVSEIPYNTSFNIDIYILLGGTAFLFAAMFMSGKKKLDRWEAALLLTFYIGYISWQIVDS